MNRAIGVLFAVVALEAVMFGVGVFYRPLSEGVESIGNGYCVVDTGDTLSLGYTDTDTDGSMILQFGSGVEAFRLRGDNLFVAKWPDALIDANHHFADVRKRGDCQYWRVDTRTHEATQVSKRESMVDC